MYHLRIPTSDHNDGDYVPEQILYFSVSLYTVYWTCTVWYVHACFKVLVGGVCRPQWPWCKRLQSDQNVSACFEEVLAGSVQGIQMAPFVVLHHKE